MQLIHRRSFAVAYWVLAFVLCVLAGVGGAMLGREAAPEFTNEEEGAAATSGARFLFGLFGFVIGVAAVAALCAGGWLLMWIRQRRAGPAPVDDAQDDIADLLTDEDGRFIDDVRD